MKKITVIGGGTGSFVVLSGLKNFDIDLAAIVTMMDTGGSTGRLRDQLGVLPPGDLRQCLVALSDESDIWRKLFLYRFDKGDLKGHNFGNILLSALEKVSYDYDEVVDTASAILSTKGYVIPVTFDKVNLCVEYASGKKLEGESIIDEDNFEKTKIVKASLSPKAKVNENAVKRIEESDFIIIGPGDLYTSIVPVLLVDGVKKALCKTKAKIIYNLNLMTKMGQTVDYKAKNFLKDLTNYTGRSPDYIIANNGKILGEILSWYEDHEERPVENNLSSSTDFNGKIIEGDIINRSTIEKNNTDILTRSILRHDSEKLAEIIKKIIGIK